MLRDKRGEAERSIGATMGESGLKQAQARLPLAGRMASVGAVAAGVAHELNNPLTVVLANLEAAIRRLGQAAQQRAARGRAGDGPGDALDVSEVLSLLEDAYEGAERMRLIVRDLRTLSRAEDEGRRPVEIAPTSDGPGDRDPSRRAPAPPPEARPRRRVLIIDDEPLLARAIAGTLEQDHEPVGARSAREALARIEAGERYDVILCDLMMPEMTGMDLYDALRDVAPDQRRRMVFLTGGAFTERASSFLDHVENRLLVKPFDAATLLALVDDVAAAS